MTVLFDKYQFVGRHLKNRAVVAPITRASENVSDKEAVRYYGQRTDVGLIVN